MSNTSLKTTAEWRKINWRKLERRAYKLQKRIYQAANRGDVKAVRKLQKTLMSSWGAKALSVRRITQDNQGKKTAGVDGVKSLTPNQRLNLIGKLKLGTKAKPTRRVWIPKPGTEEKRPLGIPTMKDRALQALVKMAIEPEWEARFEPNSYGFRPGRSCHDAIEAVFISVAKKPKFVLDADISKCFDRINHQKLLEKVNTFPTIRRQLRAWLKAGVMDGKQLFPTVEGTSQGGIISPLLANIGLHGMEERIKQFAETLVRYYPRGKKMSKRDRRDSLSLIRYADDFVITHEDLSVIKTSQEIISDWLKDMGLELKPSKTRITHTLNGYEEQKPGFDFLGFNVRHYPVGKHHSKKGHKILIKPTEENIRRHYKAVVEVINKHKSAEQSTLITKLNPMVVGWANYYSARVSKDAYEKLDDLIFHKLFRWGVRRHSNKGKKWVKYKYWHTIGGDNWVFAQKTRKDAPLLRLIKHSSTSIVRTPKVKGTASPFNGNLVYWSAKLGRHPELPKKVARLMKEQQGKCAYCNLHFQDGDIWEIDHIIPRSMGGRDNAENTQLLHRHCHDVKTNLDGSIKGRKVCMTMHQVTEEPDEAKSLTSGSGDESPR